MEISEIIDAAKKKSGIKSNNGIARAIGITSAAMVRINSGFGLPSDQTMIRLGELAGIDRARALLLLNMWRTEGEAKKTYSDILSRLGTASLCFIMAIGFLSVSCPTASAKMLHSENYIVYYGILTCILGIGAFIVLKCHDKMKPALTRS